MALTFFNVKTGERRVCKTEPMIAAHLNSSDRNPNAMSGQDMGWRIAPETVIELDRIKSNPQELQTIASTFGILLENISESDILAYISKGNSREKTGAETTNKDFERQYENDIRKLRDEQARRDELIAKEREAEGNTQPVAPTDPVEEEPQNTVDLKSMKRDQLNTYAEGIGIENPKQFSNAEKLIEAINSKQEEEA